MGRAPFVTVTAAWDSAPPEADALVTDRPGLLIGIVTADCAPVLLADRGAGIVGAPAEKQHRIHDLLLVAVIGPHNCAMMSNCNQPRRQIGEGEECRHRQFGDRLHRLQ